METGCPINFWNASYIHGKLKINQKVRIQGPKENANGFEKAPREHQQRFYRWPVFVRRRIECRCTPLLLSISEPWDSNSYSFQLALSLPPPPLLPPQQCRRNLVWRFWRDVQGIQAAVDFAIGGKSAGRTELFLRLSFGGSTQPQGRRRVSLGFWGFFNTVTPQIISKERVQKCVKCWRNCGTRQN